MRTAGDAGASELSQGLEEGSCAFPADLGVVNGELGHDEPAADGGNNGVNKFPVLALEALGHGSDVLRVALNDLEVRGSASWEDGRELRRVPAEGDAAVAGSKGMLECRKANAGAGAEECNGLGVATHCVGLHYEVLVAKSEISKWISCSNGVQVRLIQPFPGERVDVLMRS